MRLRRPTRQSAFVSAVSLLAVLAVSVVGLLGAGSPASSVRLLRAGAWLQNAVNGTVSQINGYSGKASSQVRVATDSQDFHVVQRDDGAYVVDDHTGAVARVDPSQLTVGPAVAAFGAAAGPVRVVVGGEHTWEVDPVKGAVVEVDPLSLQPKGPVLPVGGGVSGDPVADKEGHLWVYVTGSGSVTRVTPDLTVSTTEVGKPDDAVALTVADGAAVAYNASAGRVLPLPSGRAMDVPPDAAQAPVVAGDAAAPTVLTVGKQVVSAVRLGQDARTVPIGALDKVTKAVLAGDRGYLLDGATKQVTMVDFSAGNSQVMGFAPVDDLLVKDGVTFLNDAKRSKALAVRDNGELVDIEKYTEGSTTEASNPVPVTQRELPASAAGVAAAPSGRNARPVVLPDLAAAPATAPPAVSDATSQAPPPAPAAPAGPGPQAPSQPPSLAAPSNVRTEQLGEGRVRVSWSLPGGGAAVAALQVQTSPAGIQAPRSVPPSQTSLELTGLPCQALTFTVIAIGSDQRTAASSPASLTMACAPGQVQALKAAATSPTQVSVSWKPQPGTTYQLRVNAGSWTTVTSPHVQDGLEPATSYTFFVRAVADGMPGPVTNVQATTPLRTVGVCERANHTYSNGSRLWAWETCAASGATFLLYADASAGDQVAMYSRVLDGQQQYVLGGAGFSSESYLLDSGWKKAKVLGYAKGSASAGSVKIEEWFQDVTLPEGRALSWRYVPAGDSPGPGGWRTYRYASFGPP